MNGPAIFIVSDADSSNPYAPPSAPLNVEDKSAAEALFPDASTGKRFVNYLIDRVAMIGFGIVVVVVLMIAINSISPDSGIAEWFENMDSVEEFLLGYAVSFLYYFSMESAFSRTIGKIVTGTKVIRENGGKPGLTTLLGRSLARLIPFEPFSFLGGNRGWHDGLSGTRVIDLRDKAFAAAAGRLSPGLAKIYRR